MKTTFKAVNLVATYGGWVLYRDGELFASPFETKKQAKEYAVKFCNINNLLISFS